MKILLISQFYYPERFSVTDIAESFVKQGHDVTVITGKPNYGFDKILDVYKKVKYEELNGVKIHRVNLVARKHSRISIIRNYLSFHRNAKRFVRHFKEKFDVVFSVSLSPVISISPALLYAKRNKVPCVLYCQDLWPESTLITGAVKKNSLMYKVLYKWSKSIYSRCDRIIVSSPSFKNYFEKELNVFDKGFNTVYQPIIQSNKHLAPVSYKHAHNFVYAGNIGSIQLVEKLVDAMKYVKTEDTMLYLMGMGSSLEEIKNKIKEENMEDKVQYLGAFPIEKAETYFTNADALIVSLKSEGYVGATVPNKAIQYMKYGKVMLGVIQGDAKELLEKANGSVFAGENEKNIAEKIDEICSMTPNDKKEFGLNNKKYFEENLTTDKLTQLLLSEINSVIK